MFLKLRSNLQHHTFIIFQSTQFYWHSFLSHPSIYYSSFLLCAECSCVFSVALHQILATHVYNACRPLPARNLACSDSGNGLQTAAHSNVHILRCWWHTNGQLKRPEKSKWHDRWPEKLKWRDRKTGRDWVINERSWDNKSKLQIPVSLSDFQFDRSVTSTGLFLSEVMTAVLTFLQIWLAGPLRWTTLVHWWDWGKSQLNHLPLSAFFLLAHRWNRPGLDSIPSEKTTVPTARRFSYLKAGVKIHPSQVHVKLQSALQLKYYSATR